MNKDPRDVANTYRVAKSYPFLVSSARQLFGSALAAAVVVLGALVVSYNGPFLRPTFTLCFLSALVAIIRGAIAGRRFASEVGYDSDETTAENLWLLFFLIRDVFTPKARWSRPRITGGGQ